MYKIMYSCEEGIYDSCSSPEEHFAVAVRTCKRLNSDGIDNNVMFYFPQRYQRLIDYPAEIVGNAVANMKSEGLSLEEIVALLKGEVNENEEV